MHSARGGKLARSGDWLYCRRSYDMNWSLGGRLAALAVIFLTWGTARAAHCGACCYPTRVVCQEQCCVPEVRYRVCYQEVWEEQTRVCYRPVMHTVMKECAYTTCRPVYEQHLRECRYTV